MLEFAGLGVAMQNGQPAIKAVADLIAPSNEDDGVAYVVESLMLGKKPEELRDFIKKCLHRNKGYGKINFVVETCPDSSVGRAED